MKVGLIGKECWEVVGESRPERESEGVVEIDNEGETVEEGEPICRGLLPLPGDRMGSWRARIAASTPSVYASVPALIAP